MALISLIGKLIGRWVFPRETEFRQIRFLKNEQELAEEALPKFHLSELIGTRRIHPAKRYPYILRTRN